MSSHPGRPASGPGSPSCWVYSLGDFAAEVEAVATIPYGELEGFPETTVGSHAGRLVLGHIGPTAVAVLEGRAHYYERGRADDSGHHPATLPAARLRDRGAPDAAGTLRLDVPPGA